MTSLWWEVQSRAILAVTLIAIAAFVAAMIAAPEWTLRFTRVLAWPIVALIAIVLFRLPLGALFEGIVLKRVSGAGVAAEFAPRAEAQIEASPAPHEFPEDLPDDRIVIALGSLVQIFQFQLDFLRHLQQAHDGLTSAAAHAWLRARLDENWITRGWAVEPSLPWLLRQGLLVLREDDRYVLGPLAPQFLEDIEGFWYAPKLF